MQVESMPVAMTQMPKLTQHLSAGPRRLWMAVLLVALFWAAFFIVGRIDKPYFYAFVYSMGSAALLLISYSIWWWTNLRLQLSQRLFGFGLVIATGAVAILLGHHTMWFAILTVGLPAVLAMWTLWMVLVKFTGISWGRVGLIVVVAVTWGYFEMLRFPGAWSDLRMAFLWRWEKTPEEKFLAKYRGASAPAADAQAPPLQRISGDWIAFRGPDRDGVIHATNIATDWNAHPPKPIWRQRVGPAWSSVIVVGDRLFTQEQRGPKETVVCYNAGTGDELWVHEDEVRFDDTVSGAGPRATPTFADGRLYTQGGTGNLNCLDAATGKRHWSRDIAAEAGAKPPIWGYASSPLVVNDLVIAFAGGPNGKGLLAYRCENGAPAWTADAGADSYSSPQLVTIAGKPQCLMLSDGGLFAVDPANGTVLWQYGQATPGQPRTGQPHLVGDAQIAVATLEGNGTSLIRVSQAGMGWKAETVWNSAQMKTEFPDFVIHEGHIYGFDVAMFCCIDAANGKRSWKEGRYGRGQVMLLADQALLLVTSEKGEIILLRANPTQSEELGRCQAIDGKTWNHAVIAHGKLFIRNAEEMACYELATR
ncbi:MAG TPA: PQQ-binding-like beta-propeller repeat protein [Gemmataceae bacterium]|jgi:outer membrane protein assembly factor BamB|nr:PQQ-binding-like beta-propeller repeat protein [Gemmataceae bacterium]